MKEKLMFVIRILIVIIFGIGFLGILILIISAKGLWLIWLMRFMRGLCEMFWFVRKSDIRGTVIVGWLDKGWEKDC